MRFAHIWLSHTREHYKSRELKLISCVPKYEHFALNGEESIDDMIIKFAKITNDLASLGDGIENDQKVRKVIWALPPSWEVKATTLKELNDKEKMELFSLIGNLKTHEMERKAREEKAPQKKKMLAFKSTLPFPTKMKKKKKTMKIFSSLLIM